MHSTQEIPLFDLYGLWQRSIWQEWWFRLFFFLGLMCVLIVFAYGIWYIIKLNKRHTKEYPDISLEEIERLQVQQFVRDKKQDQFYLKLTTILKYYLNHRFHISATSTDYEILEKLVDIKNDIPQLHDQLESIFSGAAFVKFGQQEVGVERMLQDRNMAMTIIKKTRPLTKTKSS